MSRKKPAITYLIYNTNLNGGNKVVFEHANRLSDRGYPVEIKTIFGKTPSWMNVTVRFSQLSIKDIFVRKDIIIATFWPTAYMGLFLPSKRNLYLILGWEESFSRFFFLRFFAKFSLKLPYEKIAISHYLKDKIRKYSNKNTVHAIHGCALDVRPQYTLVKKKIQQKKKYILSVLSTYKWYKGPDQLKTAVENLKRLHPEYTFILISSNEKTPVTPLIDIFYSHASQKTLRKMYKKATIFFVSSRDEGFFLPGLEAMAYGCLVITTDCGGVREYANKDNACILTSLDQLWKEDLIEKILSNKRKRKKLLETGLKTVEKFQWDTIIDELHTILNT